MHAIYLDPKTSNRRLLSSRSHASASVRIQGPVDAWTCPRAYTGRSRSVGALRRAARQSREGAKSASGLRRARMKHLEHALGREEHVVRLEVTVNDLGRVQVGEGVGHLAQPASYDLSGDIFRSKQPIYQ